MTQRGQSRTTTADQDRHDDVVDLRLLAIVERAEQLVVQHVGGKMDGLQRIAQLVAHVLDELRLELVGRLERFGAFAQGFLADLEGSQHIIGQAHITVDGKRASGEVYFYAWHRIKENGAAKDLIVCGRYIDEYLKRDGEWRIHKRRELIDWARTDPAADGFLAENPSILRAGRRGADFSETRNWER